MRSSVIYGVASIAFTGFLALASDANAQGYAPPSSAPSGTPTVGQNTRVPSNSTQVLEYTGPVNQAPAPISTPAPAPPSPVQAPPVLEEQSDSAAEDASAVIEAQSDNAAEEMDVAAQENSASEEQPDAIAQETEPASEEQSDEAAQEMDVAAEETGATDPAGADAADGASRPTYFVEYQRPTLVTDLDPDYIRSPYFDRRALASSERLMGAASARDFGGYAIGLIGLGAGGLGLSMGTAAGASNPKDALNMARAGQTLTITGGLLLFASWQMIRSAERLQAVAYEPNIVSRHRMLQELKQTHGRTLRNWMTATTAFGVLFVAGGVALDVSRDRRDVCGHFDVCDPNAKLGAMTRLGVTTLAVSLPALVTGIFLERNATRRLEMAGPQVLVAPTIVDGGAGASLMMHW